MYDHSQHGRATLAALTAGCLVLLTGCGSDPQPATGGTSATGDSATKTLVFSPLALSVPAMQGLSEGVKQYAPSQGYEVVVQDPNLDAQKQVTDLQSVIESGKADAAWVIAVQPAALSALVKIAQDEGVVMLLNGVPEDYGLSGLQPGLTFERIDYEAQGQAMGEELGNCINEKLGGTAQVIMGLSGPGTAGKEELETSTMEALAATAPGATIVSNVTISDRAAAQTDFGSALQGNPDVQAVLGNNDEGALGALGAFAAAGKELPCVTEAGGNDEVLQAVEDGKIYASVALQFQDAMVNDVDHITTMLADPTANGEQIAVPQKVIKAGS